MMNPKELKEKCPRATDAYIDWMFGIDQDDYIVEFTDEYIIIDDNTPRNTRMFEWKIGREVYDFFDDANIFVSVYYDSYMVIEHKLPFMYDVNGEKPALGYKTRRDAEQVAFEKAFVEYEKTQS
jgi:hypothetical protein